MPMKGHLKHLAMCAPMFLLAGIFLATGTGVAALLPLAVCVLMMGAMMALMGGHGGGHGGGN
jgi:hypothetical protein